MNSVTEKEPLPRKWPRKLLVWSAVILGALAVLLVLVALLVPRIINIGSVRTAIERTVSRELGGTVTIDRLNLVLLPRPEIDIRKLTISVPGAASASAASASIYAKFLPLFLGRFEISSVTLDQPVLALALASGPVKTGKRKKQPPSRSTATVLAAAGRTMPDLSLRISKGSLTVTREDETVISLSDLVAELAFVSDTESPPQKLPAGAPGDQFHITGSAQSVLTGMDGLPGPMKLTIGRFDARPEDLAVRKARAQVLDMDMKLSGSVHDYLSGAPSLDIVLSGPVGQNAATWLRDLAGLPETVAIRAPLEVKDIRLRTSGKGATALTSLTGSVTLQDGATVSLALQKKPDLFTIDRLEVKDRESNAVLRLTSSSQDHELSFTGVLMGSTLTRLVEREQPFFRRIAGDFRVHFPRDRWIEAAAEGFLEGEGVMIASRPTVSFAVDRFSVQARGRTIELRPLVLSLGTDTVAAEGTAMLSDAGAALDLDVSASRINAASLAELLKGKKADGEKAEAHPPARRLNVEAVLRIHTAAVIYPPYTAENVAMTVSLAGGQIEADLERASFCGIGLKGTLQTDNDGAEIRFEPRVRGGALNDSIRCIMPQGPEITGTYDLSGLFTSRGSWDTLLPSLQGNLDVTAKKGRILSSVIVKGIIAYLNSTSLLKDSHASLLKEGFPYETITLRGSVREGVIRLEQGMIRSKDIHLAADGDIDVRKGTLALTVLAAPFTSMDRLLGSIPIVKQIAGNALITVPVRVEGPFRAPKVKPLPVSGVGTNITNLMKNILQAPMKIVDPESGQEQERP
jgi:hypothetical protein